MNHVPHLLSVILRQDRSNQTFHPGVIGVSTGDVARSRKSKFIAQRRILKNLLPIFFRRKRRMFCRRIKATLDDVAVVVVKTPIVVCDVKSTIDFVFRGSMCRRICVVDRRSAAFRRNIFDDESFCRFANDVAWCQRWWFGDAIRWIGTKRCDAVRWIARKRGHEKRTNQSEALKMQLKIQSNIPNP